MPSLLSDRPGWLTLFFDRPQNSELLEHIEYLLPVRFHHIAISGFRGEVEMSQPIRGQGSHLGFHIGSKNTHFVEDFEFFRPVKFN